MELSASSEFSSNVLYLPEIGSTNTELLAQATHSPQDWPDFSVILTDNQTSGRGRLDRSWVANPGDALAVSVLLRPKAFDISRFGWLPLMAGLAMTNCVRSLIYEADVSLKWPNDVLVEGEKVSGILAEVLPTGDGVVIGAGLNLRQNKLALPIPTATSLALHNVQGFELDDILVRYLASLRRLYDQFSDESGDAESSGIRAEVLEASSTIGTQVLVQLPDGSEFTGKAAGLDNDGRLLVALSDPLEIRAVAAGDIKHLRQ
jgi:BirA family biotin operon repressor/biotin-[acetyl-CoA-carboxylase] ligase